MWVEVVWVYAHWLLGGIALEDCGETHTGQIWSHCLLCIQAVLCQTQETDLLALRHHSGECVHWSAVLPSPSAGRDLLCHTLAIHLFLNGSSTLKSAITHFCGTEMTD